MKSEHKWNQHKASSTVSKFTMVLVDKPCRAAQLSQIQAVPTATISIGVM
jgi:hypothetical protein